jgi:Domain of unknown function (DUF4386)
MEYKFQISAQNAFAAGVCFIAAAVTSIIGKLLYVPLLTNPDYLEAGANAANQIVLGAICELLLAVSAVGTAIYLYPFLGQSHESLGMGYVIFRTLEVVIILIGLTSVLGMLTLSHAYGSDVNPDAATFHIVGRVLKGIHDWSFILGPNFMLGVNTFIYSYVFFAARLVPRKIAILGIFAAILIFLAAILELFGIILQVSVFGFLLAVPIFFYEMTVAVWLMRKGIN